MENEVIINKKLFKENKGESNENGLEVLKLGWSAINLLIEV